MKSTALTLVALLATLNFAHATGSNAGAATNTGAATEETIIVADETTEPTKKKEMDSKDSKDSKETTSK